MCAEADTKKAFKPSLQNLLLTAAVILGLSGGYLNIPLIYSVASVTSELFVNLLKFVSLPIIFLSVVATASNMENLSEIRRLGKKTIKYTLLTTVFAATVALILFRLVNPVRSQELLVNTLSNAEMPQGSYLTYFIRAVPSNILAPFIENNVIGVLFIAILLSCAILNLPSDKKETLGALFSSLYAAVMTVTKWIVLIMPLGIWAFITLFVRDLNEGLPLRNLLLYLVCVVAANLAQAFFVLPLLLKSKKLSPFKLARHMFPALSVAFFTKSSSATLPMAMRCAEERAGIPKRVTGFVFPLCTTINMNGCAAFILTTVLFVSMSYGMTFSPAEMIAWIFIATIAAVGNAGVPMGCYFLSGAILASMNVPLNILGIILPVYTLIDMLETAINVWSDSCVAAIVDQEIKTEAAIPLENPTTVVSSG